ncbi:Maf1-domain-containing protein [Coccomyxa subellipsoidea C-169]|uniref:Repressor of RNA polymerase III transcription n=1 Tax=Coccomyxa subellipsoidea (strain C-169) TaxID=574566 RepID=I0YZQ0_COCSC|nr:Maf1-domain-containing protein [Coccomyxa subellipsoidea C-169]EIE23869.1 Maf1-domain-containing protein [Coccomyxa subellipsoidea C-169]|eukprot:XP_005648413.1 Maf1-domain-containing protein [Coccomyxa subellipsoidea C-169]
MKFLEYPSLARLSAFLDNVDVGDYIVQGDIEAYSCKLAGLDKKLSRNLDQEVQLGSSPLELSKSPVGPLAESSSRKTLIYLILTLNHCYPDYDFSLLRAHHFKKEPGVGAVEEAVDSHLLEVSRVWENTPGCGEAPFLDSVWTAIDEALALQDCDVYSYKSDGETDPFGEVGNVWSFNFFFYNRKLKRILYFACRGRSRAAANSSANEQSTGAYNSDEEAGFKQDDVTSQYGGVVGTLEL